MYETLKTYWHFYGGFRELLKSSYFRLAFFLWLIAFVGVFEDPIKLESVLSFYAAGVHSILGFSIGGLAIIMAFQGRLITASQDKVERESLIIRVCVTFFHFILMQSIFMTLYVFTLIFPNFALRCISLFLMLYSILSAVALAAILFQFSRLLNIIDFKDDGEA